MSFFINTLLLIGILLLGVILGKKTLNKRGRYYDLMLLFLVIISTWIGVSTYIIHFNDIQLRMPHALQMIFLGIFFRRMYALNFKTKLVK